MGPSYVRLVLDLVDPQGNPLNRGQASITPSIALTDVPDMQVIPPAPVPVRFEGAPSPAAVLLASDNGGPQPAGWSYSIEFTLAGLGPWSFYVPAGPVSFTATSTNPSVFAWTPAGGEAWQLQQLPVGTGVQLSGGSIPSGFSEGATYFVASSTGYEVELAAYQGGPALGSLVSGAGELTVVQWQLSALAPVQLVAEMGGYLPLPAGSPSAGQVPVATGSGSGTRWGNGAGDKTYSQAFSASSSVSVPHNLGKNPAVTVMDSAGDECEGDVQHTDLNNLTVTFSAPFSGTVTCN